MRRFIFGSVLAILPIFSCYGQTEWDQNANGCWYSRLNGEGIKQQHPHLVRLDFLPHNFRHTGRVFKSSVTDIEVGRRYVLSDIMKVPPYGHGDFSLMFSACGLSGAVSHLRNIGAGINNNLVPAMHNIPEIRPEHAETVRQSNKTGY